MNESLHEVEDAIDLDPIVNEAERVLKIYPERDQARALRNVVHRFFPNGTDQSIIDRAENSVFNALTQRRINRIQQSPKHRIDMVIIRDRQSRMRIIGQVQRRNQKHWMEGRDNY